MLGRLEGVEHVLGLARLADEDPDVLGTHRGRVLGDELRRQHGDRGAPGELGEVDGADRGGVEARAAADQVEMPGVPHLLHQGRHVRARVQQVQELAGDLRLLVDLLEP